MDLVDPRKSWKHGTEFYEGEMVEAFIASVTFCVMLSSPPECGQIEDEWGPYKTQAECEVRIHQMFGLLSMTFPPGSVYGKGSCYKVEGERL